MIKAIVFDCFGVLTTDGWLPFKAKYFGKDVDLMERATSLNTQSDAGLIHYHDFIQDIADMAGLSVTEARRGIEDNMANKPLFEYIAQLKANYKIGLLSNSAANWLNQLFTPAELTLFDATALSYQMGYGKPDPRAYITIAERLGVAVEECVLIDDQERYCIGAREAGMQAIWYRDVEQTRAELTKLLANTKD